jgi:hypothetical protein
MAAFRPLPPAHEHSNSNNSGDGGGDELMNVPVWAWWTFGLSLLLVRSLSSIKSQIILANLKH